MHNCYLASLRHHHTLSHTRRSTLQQHSPNTCTVTSGQRLLTSSATAASDAACAASSSGPGVSSAASTVSCASSAGTAAAQAATTAGARTLPVRLRRGHKSAREEAARYTNARMLFLFWIRKQKLRLTALRRSPWSQPQFNATWTIRYQIPSHPT